jgi:hypothetical protein
MDGAPRVPRADVLTKNLAHQFDTAVRSRGDRYVAEGRVRRLKINHDGISARVTGTHEYDVFIDIDRRASKWYVSASCDCAYSADWGDCCKHIWAVLRLAEQKGLGPLGKPPSRIILDCGDDPDVDWANDFDRVKAELRQVEAELKERWRRPPFGRA